MLDWLDEWWPVALPWALFILGAVWAFWWLDKEGDE
jgi:hypothetical protein